MRTQVDLGEDLLAEKTSERKTDSDAISFQGDPAELLKKAEILEVEGWPEEAKKVLHAILRDHPGYVPAREKLEKIHESEVGVLLGRQGAAEAPSSHADESDDPEKVLQRLDSDLRLNLSESSSFSILQSRASLENLGHDLSKELAASPISEHVDLAIAFLEMGLGAAAEKILLPIHQKSASARFVLCWCLLEDGRPFEAILLCEEFLGDGEVPDQDKLHFRYLMGRAHEAVSQPEAAAEWYRRVFEMDPGYRDARSRFSRLQSVRG